MEITFVRHGESESNVLGRWQGQGDSVLSAHGRKQAKALGLALQDRAYDIVVASDLQRAAATAHALNRPLTVDSSWREIDVGAWEGMTRPEVAARFPAEVEALARGEKDVRVGGGESWNDLSVRIDDALRRLRARLAPGSRALVVSHGGVISNLAAGLLGIRAQHPRTIGRLMNTSVTTFRFQEGASTEADLLVYNDAAHCSPIGDWAKERLAHGDAVVTLVAHDPSEDDSGSGPGRSGEEAPLTIERLGGWYGALEHLYAEGEGAHRDAGALLASRHRGRLADEPLETSTLSLARLGARHPGVRVGAVVHPSTLRTLAHDMLGAGSLGEAGHGTVAHVVVARWGSVLADYNVAYPTHTSD